MISCYGTFSSGSCSSTISRRIYYHLFVFAGCGMAAAIDASVLVSVGVKDAGDGDSHCHDIQQILFVVGQKGFSGVRKKTFNENVPSA